MSDIISHEHRQQSAAAPSPFPPIAAYASPSYCHTGALVARDGSEAAARIIVSERLEKHS